jgi:hypothetical protein
MSTISAGTTSGTALVSSGDTTGQLVLQTNGTTTAVTIGTNQVVTLAQPLPVASGGTGSASGLNLATSVTGTLPIANGGTGTTSTQFANLTTNVTGTLPVSNGGTGATTLTGVLKGNGTSAFSAAVSGTDIKTVNSNSLLGSGNVSVGTVTSVGGTGSANGLSLSGTVSSTGDITLSGTNYTSNNVLLGNGTSAFQTVAPGSNGNILTSNGSTWVSQAPSGGNYVFVTSSAASGVTSVSLSLSGGVSYMLLGMNITIGSDSSGTLNATFGNLTSSLYSAGGNYYDGSNVLWYSGSQPRMRLVEGRFGGDRNNQYQHVDFVLWINPGVAGTTFPTVWAHSRFTGTNSAQAFSCVAGGSYSSNTTAATSIVIDVSAGTTFSGNFYLYKITT